jgi:hypothetical protein
MTLNRQGAKAPRKSVLRDKDKTLGVLGVLAV